MIKRNTLQRDLILQVMAKADRPLSVDEIFDTAKKLMRALGIATVYRSLKSFKDEGVIREVDLPGRASRWEIAGKAHHHHFLCDKCDRLFEVQGCPGDIKGLVPLGYTLEQHDILLQGQCVDCAAVKNKAK